MVCPPSPVYPPKPTLIWICTPPDLPESPEWDMFRILWDPVFEIGGIKFRRKSGRRVNGRATSHGRLDWFAMAKADEDHWKAQLKIADAHRVRKAKIGREALQKAKEDSKLEGWQYEGHFFFIGFCGKLYVLRGSKIICLDGGYKSENNLMRYSPIQSWEHRISELRWNYELSSEIPESLRDRIDSLPDLPTPWEKRSDGWYCRNIQLISDGEGWTARIDLPDGSYVLLDSVYSDGIPVSLNQAAQEAVNAGYRRFVGMSSRDTALASSTLREIKDLRHEFRRSRSKRCLGWTLFYGEELLQRRSDLADLLEKAQDSKLGPSDVP